MADTSTPVEGDSILDQIGDTVGGAVSAAGDLLGGMATEVKNADYGAIGSGIVDTVTSAPETVANMVTGFAKDVNPVLDQFTSGDAKGGIKSLFSPLLSQAERQKTGLRQFTDEDRDTGKELNDMNAWEMMKELGGALTGAAKSKSVQEELKDSFVSGVDPKEFEKRVAEYRKQIEDMNKNASDIAGLDPRFMDYRKFMEDAEKEYLETKGVKTVEDKDDFANFLGTKFASVDPAYKAVLSAQYQALNEATKGFDDTAKAKQAEMQAYVDASIKAPEGMTGTQAYEQAMEKISKVQTEGKWFGIQGRVRSQVEKEVDASYAENSKLISKTGGLNDELKDEITDQITAMELYKKSILGNKDLPDNEYLASRFMEGADVKRKLMINFGIAYELGKNRKDLEGMDEVEKRKEINKEQWMMLSEDEKKKLASMEGVVTGISQVREWTQAGKNAADLNPKAILDGASFVGSGIQYWVDKAFEHTGQDVPHYVQQEMRSLLYTNEGNGKKLMSMLSYNPDALVSMAGAARAMSLPTKALDKFITNATAATNAAFRLSPKIGFTQGYMKIIPNALRGASESVMMGAATDPVIDNLMVEAPTDAMEEFNNFTNLFFDAGTFTMGKGVRYGTKSGNEFANGIMWNFMNSADKKTAVNDMEKLLRKERPEIQFETQGLRDAMDEAERMAYNTFDTKEISEIFGTKGKLHEYLSENIRKMDDAGISEVLNSNGLHIRINDVLGVKKETFDDVEELEKLARTSPDKTAEGIGYRKAFYSKLDNFVSYAKGDGHLDEHTVPLSKDMMKSNQEGHKALVIQIKNAVNDLKAGTVTKDFTEEERRQAMDSLVDGVSKLQRNFSKGARPTITLIDGTTKAQFVIYVDDLQALTGLEGKDFMDIINEGRVEVKNPSGGLKAQVYEVKGARTSTYGDAIDSFVRSRYGSFSEAAKKFFPEENDYKLDDTKSLRHNAIGGGNVAQKLLFDFRSLMIGGGKEDIGGMTSLSFLDKFNDENPKKALEQYEGAMRFYGEFLNGMAKEFFGEFLGSGSRMINDFPFEPNKQLMKGGEIVKVGNKKVSNTAALVKHFNEQEGYVNVNYGFFYKNKEGGGELTNRLYLTFGNKVQEKFPSLAKRMDEIATRDDGTGNVAAYAKGVVKKIREVVKYSMDGSGKFDFESGFEKVNVIESTGSVDVMKNGLIDREAFDKVVDNAMMAVTTDEAKRKAIREVAFNLVDNMDSSMGQMIVPFVTNFVYKYAKHKDVIDNVVKFLEYKDGDEYVKAIANVMLDPKLYESIARKTESSELADKPFRDQMEKAWNDAYDKLAARKDVNDIKIEDLYAVKKHTKDWYMKNEYEKEIKKLKEINVAIKRTMDNGKEKFVNEGLEKVVTKGNVEVLRNMADTAAFRIAYADKIDGYEEAAIKTIQEEVADEIKFQKELSRVGGEGIEPEDLATLKKWLEGIKSAETMKAMVVRMKENPFPENHRLHGIAKKSGEKLFKNYEDKKFYDIDSFREKSRAYYANEYSAKDVKDENPVLVTMESAISGGWYKQDKNLEQAFRKEFDDGITEVEVKPKQKSVDEIDKETDRLRKIYDLEQQKKDLLEGKKSSETEEDENLLSRDLNESDIAIHPLIKKARTGGAYNYPLSTEKNRVTVDGEWVWDKLSKRYPDADFIGLLRDDWEGYRKTGFGRDEIIRELLSFYEPLAHFRNDQDGTKRVNELMSKVHKELKEIFPSEYEQAIRWIEENGGEKHLMRLNEFNDFAFTNLVRTTKITEDVIEKFSDIFVKPKTEKPSVSVDTEAIKKIDEEIANLKSQAPVTEPQAGTKRKYVPTSLIDLYNESPKFKKLIDMLEVSDNDVELVDGKYVQTKAKQKQIKEVREKISEIMLKNMGSVIVNGKDQTKDLIDKAFTEGGLLQKLEEIRDYKIFHGDKVFKKKKKGEAVLLSEDQKQYEKVVLQEEYVKVRGDEAKFGGVDMYRIRGVGVKDFDRIELVNPDDPDGYKPTIGGLLRKAYFNLRRSAKTVEEKERYSYVGPSDGFEMFQDIVNYGKLESEKTNGYLKDAEKAMRAFVKNVGIDVDTDLIIGGIGDKDGNFRVYSSKLKKEFGTDAALVMAETQLALVGGFYEIPFGTSKEEIERLTNYVKLENDFKAEFAGRKPSVEEAVAFRDAQLSVNGKSVVLDSQKFRKREGPTGSNYRTFGGIKKDLNVLVSEEVKIWYLKGGEITVPEWAESDYFDAFSKEALATKTETEVSDMIEKLKKDIGNTIADMVNEQSVDHLPGLERIVSELDTINVRSSDPKTVADKIAGFMKNVYVKDQEDGTSAVSTDIGDLRAAAGNPHKKQFKDHFFGLIEYGNVLGKTLFNVNRITDMEGNELKLTMLLGKSSMKLKGGYEKYAKPKYVYRNGTLMRISGEIKGTDTSFFKNAATDAIDEELETSVSESIKNRTDTQFVNEFERIQRNAVLDVLQRLKLDLGDPFKKISASGSVNEIIARLAGITGVGAGTDSVVKAKVDAALKEIDKILNKPKEEGQSVFIAGSTTKIKPNQIIMSENSKIVQLIKKQQGEELAKVAKEKGTDSQEWKDLDAYIKADKGLYTSGFRYPVPSKYNLGGYEILLSKNFKETKYAVKDGKIVVAMKDGKPDTNNPYERLSEEVCIMHPNPVFAKLEGDFDGDHLYLLSARSEYGSIIAKAALNLNVPDDVVKKMDGGFENEFIVVEQAPPPTKGPYLTLDKQVRMALKAKTTISNVSATIRTFNTLKYVFEMMDKDKDYFKENSGKYVIVRGTGEVRRGKKTEIEEIDKFMTIGELFKKYKGLVIGTEFQELAASILQMTLDFGASGKNEFSKKWATQLVQASRLGLSESDMIDFFTNIISPISQSANSFDMKDFRSYSMLGAYVQRYGTSEITPDVKAAFEHKQLGKKYEKTREDGTKYRVNIGPMEYAVISVNRMLGSKRKIVEDLMTQQQLADKSEMNFANVAKVVNNSYDPRYLLREVGPKVGDAELTQLCNDLGDIGKYKSSEDINFTDKNLPTARKGFEKYLADSGVLSEKTKVLGKEMKLGEYLIKVNEYFQKKNNEEFANHGEQEKAFEALFPYDGLTTMSEKQRVIIMIDAVLHKEYKLYSMLTEDGRIDYSIASDERRIEQLEKVGIDFNKPMDVEEAKAEIRDAASELEKLIEASTDPHEMNALNVKLERAEENLEALESFLEPEETIKKDVANAEKEMDALPPESSYFVPEVSFQATDVSVHAMNEIASRFNDVKTMQEKGLKLTIDSLFRKYLPDFYAKYYAVNDMLNSSDEMFEGVRNHFDEFGNSTSAVGKNAYSTIKAAGYSTGETDDFTKKIQRMMIRQSGGRWETVPMEQLLELAEKEFVNHPTMIALFKNDEFVSRLARYSDVSLTPVTGMMNRIQDVYGLDIKIKYAHTGDASVITDIVEAYKGDAKFVAKLEDVGTREAFEARIEANAKGMDASIFGATKRILGNVVFGRERDWIDKTLGLLQGVHYNSSYGTAATLLTQNNIAAGLSQILPNYVELRSVYASYAKELIQADRIRKTLKSLEGQNVLRTGTGHGMELRQSAFEQVIQKATKDLVEKVVGLTPADRRTAVKAGEIVDSAINNMLGFNDWPLEEMRKNVAILTTMQKWGVNEKQLMEMLDDGGQRMVDLFNSHVASEFINSGGGVVTGGIGRGTLFEHMNEYLGPLDNFVTQFAVKSFGYLMGWSFHKGSVLLEKEAALITGLKLMASGDAKAGLAHIEDFFRYNAALSRQTAYAFGVYLKFQKYEKDDKDRMDFESFARSFMNSAVSLEILVARHIKEWQAAKQFGSNSDAAEYTTYGIVSRMFRLFKQPQLINVAYDKYQADAAMGKGDVADAFLYAFENQYSSYMKISGMGSVDSAYDQLASKGNLGILGTGGNTVEDELINGAQGYKNFASWKDKGSVMAFLNQFSFLVSKDDSSLGYKVVADMAQQIKDRISKDPEISKLMSGSIIGTDKGQYDLATIIGRPGASIDEAQAEAIRELWKQISYGGYTAVDKAGRRTKYDGSDLTESKNQQMLEKQIDAALKKSGLDMEALIAMSPKDPAFLKTVSVLELHSNLKTPAVIAAILKIKETKMQKELKETSGKATGITYGKTEGKYLSAEQNDKIHQSILSQYQSVLNLDNTIVHTVMDQHVKQKHGDLFKKFESIDKYDNVRDEVMNLINTQQLVTNNMRLYGDVSSVTKLNSRYAYAMRGLKTDNATGVEVATQWMRDIEDAPWMDAKTKLAHQAAVIYGLNKSQYGLLKDDAEFAKLSEGAQRQLTNWLYKVSSASLDFDSKSYVSQMNAAASNSKAVKDYNPGYKSKAFSDKRPNFSKQFEPVRQFLQGKQPYLSKSPEDYLYAGSQSGPQRFGYNPARNEYVRDYQKEIWKQTFFGFESKGIIRGQYPDKSGQGSKPAFTQVNIKKAKTAKKNKGSMIPKGKIPKKVSKGLIGGMPIANYEN